MATNVGGIEYTVTLDTAGLIAGQRKVDSALKQTAGSLETFAARLTPVAAAVAALAVAMAALKVAELADEFRLLAARVEIAAGSTEAGKNAFADLVKISRDTSTSLQGNVEVFNRLNQSLLQMGGTQKDTLLITDLLSKAIKVSGANAVEAKSALQQFGQALGSGKLAGDEFKTVMEAAPYLMKQLAASLGVPIGQLKTLSTQGKLTSDVVVTALSKAADSINKDFEKVPQTIAGAMQVASDSAGLAVAGFENLTNANTPLIGIIKGVAEVFELLNAQTSEVSDESAKLSRNEEIKTWSSRVVEALSYVIDAGDLAARTIQGLGTLASGVAQIAGKVLGGVAAIGSTLLENGGLKQAKQMYAEMSDDVKMLGTEMGDSLDKIGNRGPLAGMKMRQQAADPKFVPEKAVGDLKGGAPDPKIAAAAAARRAAAKAYLDGLIADNKTAIEKVDAEEEKALSENAARRARDAANADIYEKAKVEISKKYATQRAMFEEKNTQGIAELNIAMTTDEVSRIEAVRAEAVRRADAAVKLGSLTFAEAERQKTLAVYTAQQQRNAIQEHVTQTNADNTVEATIDNLTKIDLARQESFRRADAAARSGAITYAQAEADKARAAIDAQNAIRQQVMSVNPLATLQKEYEDKLAIVQYYEQQMAQAGVDGTTFVEAKRMELTRQYQQQRLALAETEFAAQSDGNQFLMDSINSLSQTATSSIAGLLTGTMSATDAMRSLAGVVLNEAVGSLVQIGVQYLKNAIIGQAADKAMLASKAANAAMYTAAVGAQVAVNSSLAASAAFASTVAIPIVGLAAAPGAAAAAAAATAALGAPAVASAPLAGARQYGGPANAGGLYKINETGMPEMFTASNGSQYMLPTKSGSVTPADKVGAGGVTLSVQVVNNHSSAQIATQRSDDGQIVQIVVSEITNQISSNSGPVWNALKGSTNVRSVL